MEKEAEMNLTQIICTVILALILCGVVGYVIVVGTLQMKETDDS